MKKSTLIMILSLVLAVAIGIGSTMAYLQDTDEDVNVMTLGNVYIEQIELERGEDGILQEFTQGQPLYPAVYDDENAWGPSKPTDPQNDPNTIYWATADENGLIDGIPEAAWNGMWKEEEITNVVDKFVFVKNTGKSDAYIRTIFAFEQDTSDFETKYPEEELIRANWNSNDRFDYSQEPDRQPGDDPAIHIEDVVIDDVTYTLVVVTYTEPVAPGEVIRPSLLQVGMSNLAGNKEVEQFGETYDILVVSQAVQTQGFADADTALKAAFGVVDADNNPWKTNGEDLDGTPVFPSAAGTADELKAALAAGGEVYLTGDIDVGSEIMTIAKDTTIDLKGFELSGETGASQGHLIMVKHGATLNIKDSSADESGKITYDAGSSNVGWTIDVEGDLNLYSGTIELTGDWSIGYGVDLRPNAWGTAYNKPSTFHMYGGKIVSSDGGIRVASTSSDTYKNVAAQFIMDGGAIEAAFDGIFIQQSNAAYDTLSVELNGGSVAGGKYPIRFYGPDATSVNSGAAKPMTLTIADTDALIYSGTDASTVTWYLDSKIAMGGGMNAEIVDEYTTIQIN